MKNLKTIILSTLIMLFASCSKDNDSNANQTPATNSENYLQGFLTQSGFNQQTEEFINLSLGKESGLKFSPTVNGKINKIRVKLPATSTGLVVTIWESTTTNDATKLKEFTIPVNTANTEVVVDTDINLEANKNYCISHYTKSFYKRRRTDQNNANFPFIVGSIKILSSTQGSNSNPQFPDSPLLNNYWGDVTFDFVKK
jgi:hypothetical protein